VPAIPIIAAVAAVASAAEEANIASKQASTASKVANYNANVDIANAQQQQMDANANIAKQRQDDAAYASKMRAEYAASGVLSGTGSPMVTETTTAGRAEQDIQQFWTSTEEAATTQYESAEMGVMEGSLESETYHLEGASDIFKGIGSVANIAGSPSGQQLLGTTGS
jgi:hypothetical protein